MMFEDMLNENKVSKTRYLLKDIFKMFKTKIRYLKQDIFLNIYL